MYNIVHLLFLLSQLMLYLYSPIGALNKLIVGISFSLSLIGFMLTLNQRKSSKLNGYNFSIILFFIMMSLIISYQIPLELALGNLDLNKDLFIYDISIVNKMVLFSGICFNSFFLGNSVIYNRIKRNKIPITTRYKKSFYKIRTNPLLALIFLFCGLFFVTVNKSYIQGGHGIIPANPLSLSFYGIFIRLTAVYVGVIVYNNSFTSEENISFKNKVVSFIKKFNWKYLSLVLICIVLFLFANNRVYIIYLVTPLIFGFFVTYKLKVKNYILLVLFLVVSSIATFLKIYGVKNIFSSNLMIEETHFISKSYFPITAELAYSIYSQSLIYYEWLINDFTLYGKSFFIGVLKSVPGLISLLGLSMIDFDSGTIATIISNKSFGIGTTVLSDSLVNIGFLGTIIFFYTIGYWFSKLELYVYAIASNKLIHYVIYFSICTFILFLPRSSFNEVIGIVLFNTIFINLYSKIYKKNQI